MLPECCCDLPLVLPQVDNLLLDHKVLGVPRQKVFELLDMLSRNVTDLWWRLGPVTKETLDGNFCASPILPKMKTSNMRSFRTRFKTTSQLLLLSIGTAHFLLIQLIVAISQKLDTLLLLSFFFVK